MKPTFLLLLLAGALLPLPLLAASNKLVAVPYHDPGSALHFSMPEGWKVHTGEINGKPHWKVLPRKADERERAAIRINIILRPFANKESLERLARKFKKSDGDREPAINLQYNAHQGRLAVEYREGQFVSGGLWLLRHYLVVYQKVGKVVIEARCSSTDAEFRHYRPQLNLVCGSVKVGR